MVPSSTRFIYFYVPVIFVVCLLFCFVFPSFNIIIIVSIIICCVPFVGIKALTCCINASTRFNFSPALGFYLQKGSCHRGECRKAGKEPPKTTEREREKEVEIGTDRVVLSPPETTRITIQTKRGRQGRRELEKWKMEQRLDREDRPQGTSNVRGIARESPAGGEVFQESRQCLDTIRSVRPLPEGISDVPRTAGSKHQTAPVQHQPQAGNSGRILEESPPL